MTLPLAYPDQELAYMHLLRPLAPTVTHLPAKWKAPIIHIQRIGGGPDEWDVTDYALMRVIFYGADRGAAWALAGQGESLLLSMRGRAINRPDTESHGLLIDFVALDVGGVQDPDLDPDDRRVIKNFTTGMRRQVVGVPA